METQVSDTDYLLGAIIEWKARARPGDILHHRLPGGLHLYRLPIYSGVWAFISGRLQLPAWIPFWITPTFTTISAIPGRDGAAYHGGVLQIPPFLTGTVLWNKWNDVHHDFLGTTTILPPLLIPPASCFYSGCILILGYCSILGISTISSTCSLLGAITCHQGESCHFSVSGLPYLYHGDTVHHRLPYHHRATTWAWTGTAF